MKFPPVSVITLSRLLRRDGFSFFGKCARYALSRDAWLWLLRGGRHVAEISTPGSDWSDKSGSGTPVRTDVFGPMPDLPAEERERSRRVLAGYSPKISIVVASYNYAHLIGETLDSLLAQTYLNFEVLVIDNASTDNSVEVIKKYVDRDPRFKLAVHEKNLGLPGSVKHGVELATGEFVAFCEADDLWTPDHLEKKVSMLRERWGEPNFIINDIELFGDPERCEKVKGWLAAQRPALAGVRNRISPARFRALNYVETFSIVMVRRSILLSCDILSVPRPSNVDWWLWRQIGIDNDIWVVHDRLTKWRLHKDSYLARETRADPEADREELASRMDMLLHRKHSALADGLVPFLRPEDLLSCVDGRLFASCSETSQPSFSIVLISGDRSDLEEATIESVASQTYGNFELVVVHTKGPRSGAARVRQVWMADERLSGKMRVVGMTSGDGEPSAFEAGVAASSREWTVPVFAGDLLRPDALKTFAARIVLDPDANGVYAIARTMAGKANFGGPATEAAGGSAVPFACIGSFAFRRLAGSAGSSVRHGLSSFEARISSCVLSSSPLVFARHIVLYRNDGPNGRDPESKALLAAVDECRKARQRTEWHASKAEASAVRRSSLFDAGWYLREWPGVTNSAASAVNHYLTYGSRSHDCNPSPDFIGDEYLSLNQDVRDAGMNPLVHFECFGRKEGRPFSFLQIPESACPDGAIETERSFPAAPRRHRRVAVFAAHSGDATIPESTLLYLRGLKEVVDDIVFVASNPVLPEEVAKLDGMVRHAIFRSHGGYDFLSYRIGREKARELGLLDPESCDELVVCNDSCYAPVLPFPPCFAEMSSRRCDFWGMTANSSFVGTEHVQSYFFVFRRPVLDDGSLDRFLDSVEPISDRWEVIRRYEAGLTAALVAEGHSWDTLVPKSFASENGCTPTKRPLALMSRFDMPLLKRSAMKGDMKDDRDEVLAFVRAHNPELAAVIPAKATPPDYDLPRRLREAHPLSFASKIETIRRERIGKGLPVRALFLVFSPSMFPARPLLDAMLRDAAFDARILVIPDLRWRDQNPEDLRTSCRKDLGSFYPADRFLDANADASGEWPDVIGDFGADIVCYPSPYDLSNFRYNPHWAVGRGFLPIYISYSFSTSRHGYAVYGRQNYAYFWKVFVECESNAREYAEHSILKGANAETVGYFKMDALANAKPWPRNGARKRVLIAPHHSVEGGANDTLALSNFQRYADYFLALPEKHPELDFVFRPHPFLFTVLARPGKWGQEKVDGWIARMKAHPNVRWSDEGDYFPAFASCDAIIQDCGSYLAEWVYTGKPCCFMLKSPADVEAKFTPLGRDILSRCYLAYDEPDIESFLRGVVEGGSDPKAAARDEFRDTVMVNYPHAADAALASIKKALGVK